MVVLSFFAGWVRCAAIGNCCVGVEMGRREGANSSSEPALVGVEISTPGKQGEARHDMTSTGPPPNQVL